MSETRLGGRLDRLITEKVTAEILGILRGSRNKSGNPLAPRMGSPLWAKHLEKMRRRKKPAKSAGGSPYGSGPFGGGFAIWDDLSVEVLNRIATIVKAANPAALTTKLDLPPLEPTTDLGLVLSSAASLVGFDLSKSPTPKEKKQIKQVEKMAKGTKSSIQLLEETALRRLNSEYWITPPLLKEIRALADGAHATSLSKEKKVPHRPRKSYKNRSFQFLIAALYRVIVVEAQGSLTLWQDAGDLKGTLPVVLDVLRPYIPRVLPVRIPFSTLHRALVRVKKARSSRVQKGSISGAIISP